MSNLPHSVVTETAYLTLHYRLASGSDSIVTTFEGNPATLQMGAGQLAPFLEANLIGLPEGARQTFALSPDQAFGPHNPELVKRISRASLTQHVGSEMEYQAGDLLEFVAPGGTRFAAILREINSEEAVIDLNHPLAGQPVSFEVQIIAIL